MTTNDPIVLWSDHCQGNLYLAKKNTFLEFYSDAAKAIKRSACPRSASADSCLNRPQSSGHIDASPSFYESKLAAIVTPTKQSQRHLLSPSPSDESKLSSDDDIMSTDELPSFGTRLRPNTNWYVGKVLVKASEMKTVQKRDTKGCEKSMALPTEGEGQKTSPQMLPKSPSRSTQETATPTNLSSPPSSRSTSISDCEVARLIINAELQSPDATPVANSYRRHDAKDDVMTMLTSNDWDANFGVTDSAEYQMKMSRTNAMSPCLNEIQKVMQSQKVKPFSKKNIIGRPVEPTQKRDLRKLERTAAGTAEVTTLMIRGIPCKFSQNALLSMIDEAGLRDKYDFFYLPFDAQKDANLGYAFINFVDQQSAEHCTGIFTGVQLSPWRSPKRCSISPATIQGLPHLREHFHRTAVSCDSRGPVFFNVRKTDDNPKKESFTRRKR